jgi:mannosyltransferase OCH1-like enzyme
MEKFVKTEYADFYKVYMSYPHNIQRCDAFRYLVLYKYGGIYIDMDTICKKNLKELLVYDIVFTYSTNASCFTNAFFMVIPNHPFIKFCIDNLSGYVNSYYYFGKHFHIMNSTGPYFLTNMVKKYKEKNIENLYILSSEEYAGDCTVCNEDTCQGGIYFKHIVGQSWNSWDSLFYNFCFCNYKKIIIILLVLVTIYYIFFKRNKVFKMKKYFKI